jgi:hypothetical protein
MNSQKKGKTKEIGEGREDTLYCCSPTRSELFLSPPTLCDFSQEGVNTCVAKKRLIPKIPKTSRPKMRRERRGCSLRGPLGFRTACALSARGADGSDDRLFSRRSFSMQQASRRASPGSTLREKRAGRPVSLRSSLRRCSIVLFGALNFVTRCTGAEGRGKRGAHNREEFCSGRIRFVRCGRLISCARLCWGAANCHRRPAT